MNNELHSLILSNARERVAKEHGYADWLQIDYSEMESCERDSLKLVLTEEAALIAMEDLAGFLRWMFIHGYDLSESEKRYTQYLNEKKDADK